MTTDEKQLQDHLLDISIMKALAACGDYLLPHPTLIQSVQVRHAPRPLASEVERRIQDLDARHLINPLRTPIGVKHGLTDAGRAFLQEHG